MLNKVMKMKTKKDMKELLKSSKSEDEYKVGSTVTAINKMDKGKYKYKLTAEIGDFEPGFKPAFTPREMLELGVFEGKYMNDCILEFPREWFEDALDNGTLSPEQADINCNFFGIKSRQSLQEWIRKGWIPIIDGDPDNRGWFQWYCRYYLGRRIPKVDKKQISRWKAFKRHKAQVDKNCDSLSCRPKQRQALLQWAYNAFD